MGKTFRNVKRSFEDDYGDNNYTNVKNKRKKQKALRESRNSKNYYNEEYEDENKYGMHYR